MEEEEEVEKAWKEGEGVGKVTVAVDIVGRNKEEVVRPVTRVGQIEI